MNLMTRKPLSEVLGTPDEKKGFKRTLTASNLVALGVGAIIGAGLFVRTASAAGEAAGPAVIISFLIAAVGCAFAGLCYAEFAAMIPVAGSAYTYAYVTLGEFIAWVIGWALILEYALTASTLSIAWSEYLNNLTGYRIPYEWCHSPFETSLDGISGIMNIPALLILTIISLILIKGTQESVTLNTIIVIVKVAIVLVFIAVGWQFIDQGNYSPFMIDESVPGHQAINRHGWGGILGGAGIVFFAFIGFDAVSTAAQEAKNPQRDMPIGILGSLVVCTILYMLFAHVLTGVANWSEFKTVGKEASVAYAIQHYMPGYDWLATAISVAILAGFSSVMLVMLMGQSRIFYSMANDGLLPKLFSELHPKFKTPYKSNIVMLLFVGLFALFAPGSLTGDLTSIGTLFAFIIVCAGVWIMRIKAPQMPRPFKTPLMPLVPAMGILICFLLILSLDFTTQLAALGWIVIGIVVYFLYGAHHSRIRHR
ncbi:MAG TPA: amino acid permease [Chryseosolibacter sp.]